MANETQHAAKHDLVFDVGQLCRLVADLPAVGPTVAHIEKFEGRFNKTLRLTAENGVEVFAKLPCPNVVPAAFITASEVAIMDFGEDLLSCDELRLSKRGTDVYGLSSPHSAVSHIHFASNGTRMERRRNESGGC